MNLNFNSAEVQENTNKSNGPSVIKTGVHEVVTSEIKGGVSNTEKQSPFIDWTVKDASGSICTHRYYTSEAAWKITSSAILQLLMAITNSDKDTARGQLNTIAAGAKDMSEFSTKLSALVIGKPFAIKINGEEVLTQAGKKFVKSKFGNYTFALPTGTPAEKFGKVYIKPLPVVDLASADAPTNDLPF